ncbi:MAG: S8 family serine peptidase [Lentisphaerae bacterium]|nr:S8 family serine peptidase [Lentisphaerota bacterium]
MISSGNLSLDGSTPTGPGYLAWLAAKGFTQAQFDASGFIVDIVDDGFDNGNAASPANSEFRKFNNALEPSRVAYAVIASGASGISSPNGVDGHGNINASIVGGYNNGSGTPDNVDGSGYHYGLGICPFANLGSTKLFQDGGSWAGPNETQMVDDQYAAGCRISSDSWGAPVGGDYNVDCQNYDAWTRDTRAGVAGNQEMLFVFAAGNSGPTAGTIGSPGTAKNVLTIGASENVNPFGTDGCGTSDSSADNANDIVGFSSRGPCDDARAKPDLVGPGAHIHGAASYDPAYNGSGVCDQYNPAGQTKYAESSGTSHSTPAVAGGAALATQYFLNLGWPMPSPAMVKAYLMNSAHYLTGASANDDLWSPDQGMGSMDLGVAFDSIPRLLRDQVADDEFTGTGQIREYGFTVADDTMPVRVTLAWTDAPGSTTGNAYNNDLDLEVTAQGLLYKGNVFSKFVSTTNGSADPRNNVESVWLPAGTKGDITVTVTAANINSDGVPGDGDATDQDFALVIYNASTDKPTAFTSPATDVTTNSAVLNGSVNPNGTNAWYFFEYGTSTNYGQSTPVRSLDPTNSPVAVDEPIGSLSATTNYYFRLVAYNALGTNVAAHRLFSTLGPPVAPAVTTLPADQLTDSEARLNGDVDPGFAETTWHFQYGTTIAYGSVTPPGVLDAVSEVFPVSHTVTALVADAIHHFRLVASNSAGVTYGIDRSFATLEPEHLLLEEDFEHGGALPPGWTQTYEKKSVDWTEDSGGYDGNPSAAHGGDYNALFFVSLSGRGAVTRLVTPELDFEAYTNFTTLTFWHAMIDWAGDLDKLRLYYQTAPAGSWTLLTEYTTEVSTWTERIVALPEPSGTYRLAFEASGEWGYGVCVDDVRVSARGVSGPAPPTALALPADNVGRFTAQLNGKVEPNQLPTASHFDYGTGGGWQFQTPTTNAGSGGGFVTVAQTVTGLSESVTYDVRLIAENSQGSSTSAPVSFTTLAEPGAPLATTLDPGGVGLDGAVFHGTVDPQYASTAWHFEYGPDRDYGSVTPGDTVAPGAGAVAVTNQVSGLTQGSTYRVRLVASNVVGVSYGGERSFSTTAPLLFEDFEHGGAMPVGWTGVTLSVTEVDWTAETGGYNSHPPDAFGGSYNARFFMGEYGDFRTRLITPAVDFGGSTNSPELTFQQAMGDWLGDIDELHVYYQSEPGGAWTLLGSFLAAVETWTPRDLVLPNPSGTYRLAFEGVGNYGYGVCIDDVRVTGAPDPAALLPDVEVSGSVSAVSSNTFALEWDSRNGFTYAIEYTGTLGVDFSPLIDGIPADPPLNTYTDTVEGIPLRFYQVFESSP